MNRYAVGIDPGKTSGLAVYDRHDKKLVNVISADFWMIYNKFYASNPNDYEIYIEVSDTKALHGWKDKNNSHTKSVNIGMALREAQLLADGIERLGFIVHRITPKQKGKKQDHEYVKNLTGYSGKTNEHTRDAIMLCWGR